MRRRRPFQVVSLSTGQHIAHCPDLREALLAAGRVTERARCRCDLAILEHDGPACRCRYLVCAEHDGRRWGTAEYACAARGWAA